LCLKEQGGGLQEYELKNEIMAKGEEEQWLQGVLYGVGPSVSAW
jgi:hypothetical protein